MATLKSAIQLYDGMSPALRSMNKTLGIVLSTFESLKMLPEMQLILLPYKRRERNMQKQKQS